MIDGRVLQEFRGRVESELEEDILPFWLKYAIDEEYGGFRGRISNSRTCFEVMERLDRIAANIVS